jgi:hypothetical protein
VTSVITISCPLCKGKGSEFIVRPHGNIEHDVCHVCGGKGVIMKADQLPDYSEDQPLPPLEGAWMRVDAWTLPDGSIEAMIYTNDNLDLGYPNEEVSWTNHYKDVKEFLEREGLSRVGPSGIMVEILLDNTKI